MRTIKDVVKDREILRILNRTKKEIYPDLQNQRLEQEQVYKAERKRVRISVEKKAEKTKKEHAELSELRSYR